MRSRRARDDEARSGIGRRATRSSAARARMLRNPEHSAIEFLFATSGSESAGVVKLVTDRRRPAQVDGPGTSE